MKAFTDIEQSKQLADILPIESADMHYSTWTILDGEFIVSPNQGSTIENLQEDYGNQIIPCWSLAALLEIINKDFYTDLYHDGVTWTIDVQHHDNKEIEDFIYTDEPIDSCYEMILKLHELNLL